MPASRKLGPKIKDIYLIGGGGGAGGGGRGKLNTCIYVFMGLHHLAPSPIITLLHVRTGINNSPLGSAWTTYLVTFSKAKPALVCMQETPAPVFNGRCYRARSASLLTGFGHDWTKKSVCLHAQCEEYSADTPMTIYWK